MPVLKSFFKKMAFWLCVIFCLVTFASSTPPDDPVKCKSRNTICTVTNSYGAFPDRSICEAAKVEYPRTEAELVSVVAAATRAGQKMRVVTRYSHSIPKLVCTDVKDGILISTKFLNHVVRTDPKAKTLTVESGVTLRELIEEAAKLELALPYAPYWWGLTVGGMMGTGAHGSSLWGNGSAVHDYVTEISIVSPGSVSDGYVKVRVLSETMNPEEFNAATVSLGVLGVISQVCMFKIRIIYSFLCYKYVHFISFCIFGQVTFKLEPMFKRSLTYVVRNDTDMEDQALTFGRQHEFADLLWLPSQGKVVYRIDDRVPTKVSGDGVFSFFPFRSQVSLIVAFVRSLGSFFVFSIIYVYMVNYAASYMFLVHDMQRRVTSCLEKQTESV